MTNSEYCNLLDSLNSNKDKSYVTKCREAYSSDKFSFTKCIKCSTLYGANKTYWEALVDDSKFEQMSYELGKNINECARTVWRAVLAASKYLSDDVTKEYATYMCTLVEYATGSRRQRLACLYERDRQQFCTLLHSTTLGDKDIEAVLRLIRCGTVFHTKKEIALLNRVHDMVYEVCRGVVNE